MHEQIKVYLELPSRIEQLLADNSLSIENILRQENINVGVDYEEVPFQSAENGRGRDLTPVILASAALILAIGIALPKVLNMLNPGIVKNVIVEEFDETGKLKSRQEIKHELLESNKENTLEIKAGNVIFIKFTESSPEKPK